MLSLGALVHRVPGLAFHDEPTSSVSQSRHATAASPADQVISRGSADSSYSSHIAVSPAVAPWWQTAESCDAAVRALVTSDVAALLVVVEASDQRPGPAWRPRVSRATSRGGIPLLVAAAQSRDWRHVLQAVQLHLTSAALAEEVRYLRGLVDHLCSPGSAGDGGLPQLMTDAARAVGGQAAVIAPDGKVIGAPRMRRALAREELVSPVARVRKGSVSSASVGESGSFVQLHGIGVPTPRPVLAVTRSSPYPPWMSALVRRTASAAAAHDRLARADALQRELTQALPLARLSVFTQLMGGDTRRARSAAASLVPAFETACYVQVHVLECAEQERSAVLRAAEDAALNRALVVACPIDTTHTVVIAPLAITGADETLQNLMQRVATDNGCRLGSSVPVPLESTRAACLMAADVLAPAQRDATARRSDRDRRPLATHLGGRTGSWAQDFLRPLAAVPGDERMKLSLAAQYVLRYGQSGAARLLGLNRKTVTVRWKRIGTLLALDLRAMQDRATLDLAFHLAGQATGVHSGPPVTLDELLRSPEARAWARGLVEPLRHDARSLLQTVTMWVACNGRVEDCALRLKAHTHTVRKHLSACEALMGLQLVGSDISGTHDVVTALRILRGSVPSVPTGTDAQAWGLRSRAQEAVGGEALHRQDMSGGAISAITQ